MLCMKCGKSLTNTEVAGLCENCAPVVPENSASEDAQEEGLESDEEVSDEYVEESDESFYGYAGWGLRVVACLADLSLIMIFTSLIAFLLFTVFAFSLTSIFGELLAGSNSIAGMMIAVYASVIIVLFSVLFISSFYKILFEWSRFSATPGKLFLGLAVRKSDGSRITFWTAFFRECGRFLNAFTLGIAYLMPLFTDKNQALHDMITDTVVIKKKEVSIFRVLIVFVLSLAFIFGVSILTDNKENSHTSNINSPFMKGSSTFNKNFHTNQSRNFHSASTYLSPTPPQQPVLSPVQPANVPSQIIKQGHVESQIQAADSIDENKLDYQEDKIEVIEPEKEKPARKLSLFEQQVEDRLRERNQKNKKE